MIYKQNEEAVSAVIGTVIMVAICCILAAVVAAFVFGAFGTPQKEHNIGITTKSDKGNVVLTVVSSDNDALGLLDHIEVYVNDVKQSKDWSPKHVSDIETYAGPFSKPTKVKLIGFYYPNNEAQIMQETTL